MIDVNLTIKATKTIRISTISEIPSTQLKYIHSVVFDCYSSFLIKEGAEDALKYSRHQLKWFIDNQKEVSSRFDFLHLHGSTIWYLFYRKEDLTLPVFLFNHRRTIFLIRQFIRDFMRSQGTNSQLLQKYHNDSILSLYRLLELDLQSSISSTSSPTIHIRTNVCVPTEDGIELMETYGPLAATRFQPPIENKNNAIISLSGLRSVKDGGHHGRCMGLSLGYCLRG